MGERQFIGSQEPDSKSNCLIWAYHFTSVFYIQEFEVNHNSYYSNFADGTVQLRLHGRFQDSPEHFYSSYFGNVDGTGNRLRHPFHDLV